MSARSSKSLRGVKRVGDKYVASPPDDDDDDDDPEQPDTAGVSIDMDQGKKRRVRKTFVPTGLDTYPWATELLNTARAELGLEAIWGMVTILVGIVPFWLAHWIPSLPPSVMRYGAIYYILLFPLFLFNFLLAYFSSVNEFYRVAVALNVAGFAMEVFLTVILVYNFYACIAGIYPSTCTGNYLIDGIVSVATIILLWKGLESLANCLFIVLRTSNLSSPRFYAYKQQPAS
jgi:hypothetical protein